MSLNWPTSFVGDLAQAFGMKPIATDSGAVVYGYGDDRPAAKLPWETGVNPIIDIKPADGPPEALWLPVYEGLVSWTGEVVIVLDDRLGDILNARETIDHLRHQAGFLCARGSPQRALAALGESLGLLRRVLFGLAEEIGHLRRELAKELGTLLACLEARWREPVPLAAKLLWYELRDNPRALRQEGDELKSLVPQINSALSDATRVADECVALRERR
jgi:hypothetical protein